MAGSWTIKNLYFYLVCLITLFLFVGGTISAINNAAQIAFPDRPNVSIIHLYYPEYREENSEPAFDPPPLEELEKMRAEQEQTNHYYRSYAVRNLLNSIALMIIATPFYIYHWNRVKPRREKGEITNEG
ncbi:MAG: hypothetical protein AVO34_08195 [Firmicutes bacterium ML8_F2]|nr:MAG: hypothetical protein AVO34_08195 [Firmicutes bacterium ML8_F2]